jgi:hypothetical protein
MVNGHPRTLYDDSRDMYIKKAFQRCPLLAIIQWFEDLHFFDDDFDQWFLVHKKPIDFCCKTAHRLLL